MKIGIFGGAFNPIHNGHLTLVRSYFESLKLDKVLFVPTAVPPHKTSQHLAPAEDRLNMVSLALKDNAAYELSDIEFKRQGKSYTYDTLTELKKLYPDSEFYLIIGADQFLTFHLWYKYKEIINTVTLCTSARENEQEKQKLLEYANSIKEMEGRYYIADYPVMKLSSSEIREKLKNNEDISDLVPKKVYEYILEKELYIV
ncbi:MAG: nicotinate (nicotinamide) nucleotide adenylyltransferase [Eubacterium sp.]